MRRMTFVLLAAIGATVWGSGCYYDKASELYPEGTCDTGSVTWSKTVQPIITAQCAYVGCHLGTSPSGIDLSNYDGVHMQAANGALLGSVMHATGYEPMPKSSPKLPDCQISKLRIWVANGAPQN